MPHEEQVSIRLPSDLVKRAEKLVPRLEKETEFAAWRISRAAVLRLAVARGLEALEEQYGTRRGAGTKR